MHLLLNNNNGKLHDVHFETFSSHVLQLESQFKQMLLMFE